MEMLLDTELKQISMGAVQQFNLDVIQCECEYKKMNDETCLRLDWLLFCETMRENYMTMFFSTMYFLMADPETINMEI